VNQINVDARGLRCPLPVIRLAAAARAAPAGTRITVLASDPAARYDVPAWCRMRDHELCEITEVSDPSGMDAGPAESAQPAYLRFVVVVCPQRSKAAGAGSDSDRPSRPT
jgi:tRNA 2-thiouridine synthesizing protein A